MKLKSVLSTLMGAAASVNPLVGTALSIVNEFLPDDRKLPPIASGHQVLSAYEQLPEAQRAAVDNRLEHKLGMEKEHTNQIKDAYAHDNTGNSTRPHIAMVSVYAYLAVALAMATKIFLETGLPDWTLVAAVMAPPVLWANTYMNARKQEKLARYNAANGHPTVGFASVIKGLFK
jgi:anti-sigma-K factor RskA|tara:strand:- start:4816 stop:5340 length:525 start_codon:yes stop_codon:yes gene_type:complete